MLRGGFGSVESLGKARNLAGGLLPMDDALGGGLIQRRGGGAQELLFMQKISVQQLII